MHLIYYPNWDQKMADELIEKFELNTKQRIQQNVEGYAFQG